MAATSPKLTNKFQGETDELYKKIAEFEDATKESNGISDKYDADIRDMGKKVQKFESNLEETIEKLQTLEWKKLKRVKMQGIHYKSYCFVCTFLYKIQLERK